MSTIENNFRFYLEHQNDLVQKYNGKYLVITNNTVVGAYDNLPNAYYTALKKYEPGNFLIQLCTPGKEAYTARYYNRVTPYQVQAQ